MSARPTTRRMASARTVSSVLALATALAAGPAATVLIAGPALAQTSYNLLVDPIVASGNVTFTRGTGSTEVYTIGSPTAVIDYTPADTDIGGGPIEFQRANTTALYTSTPGGPAFTVLNRIVPTDTSRPVAFNGNVVSELRNAAGAGARGGTVWFYSPGGIVIGDGSVFDIGSLLLTTGDPAAGGSTIGSTSRFTLASRPDGGGIVNILSGATINAVSPGSYVALVAPIVFNAGTVNVNGAAAYVAAETATLTIDQGLFDINVAVGSNAAGGFPLQHLGTTRFQNAAVQNRAYLVSVPKNDVITLVIGNTTDIGFDVATTVGVENGVVVLGAGFRNVAPTPSPTLTDGFNTASDNFADILFDGGSTINAAVVGRARDTADLRVIGSTFFGSNVALRSNMLTRAGGQGLGTILTIRGDLTLDATAPGISSGAGQTGGRAILGGFNSGETRIGGSASIGAGARGLFPLAGATGASTGGTATIDASSGSISIGGNATVTASADSATVSTGGTAQVLVGSGNRLAIGGGLNVSADSGSRDENLMIGTNSGSTGTGGTASVSSSGVLQVAGAVRAAANGFGGAKSSLSAGNAGNATGGTASIAVLAGGTIAAVGATVDAQAIGGNSIGNGTTGSATGGAASFSSAGTTNLASLYVGAKATGGTRTGGAGDAGLARSGTALAQATGATGTLTVTGNAQIEALAAGGTVTGGTGAGGGASGADARVAAAGGGRISFGSAIVDAGATGGQAGGGGTGGSATGGAASVSAAGSNAVVNGPLTVSAFARGGATTTGLAGNALGGDARIVATAGGNVSVGGEFNADSIGIGGTAIAAGSAGGSGQGGTVSASQGTGGSIAIGGFARLEATGLGGINRGGGTGVGGTGRGGDVRFVSNDGTVAAAGGVILFAGGTGGGSNGGSRGGDGIGGLVNIGADTGLTSTGTFAQAQANGRGGSAIGVGSGSGGTGTGGQALIGTIGNGRIEIGPGATGIGSILQTADASGGAATGNGTTGGAAGGGTATLFGNNGGTIAVAGAADISAVATGGQKTAGDGGGSGAATGGTANVAALAGRVTVAGDLSLAAFSTGGIIAAGTGVPGASRGGTAALQSGPNAAGGTGSIDVTGDVDLDAGAVAHDAFGANVVGGNATGGNVFIEAGAGGGLIMLRGDVALDGGARGGADAAPGRSLGTGGTLLVNASGGAISIAGSLDLDATADAYALTTTLDGGESTGGSAQIIAQAGRTLGIGGITTIAANGFGGDSYSAQTVAASIGRGGSALVDAVGAVTVGGTLLVSANGTGGSKQAGGAIAGGSGQGNIARVRSTGGRLTIGEVVVSADAVGGDVAAGLTGNGGSAVAGEARLAASAGGTTIVTGQPLVQATGTGGVGGGATGVGGQGDGGTAIVPAFGGVLSFAGNLFATADGIGGGGTIGGGGGGGEANIVAQAGTLSMAPGSSVIAFARGLGGAGANGGAGGNGEGGLARIGAINGATTGLLTIDTSLIEASAIGGAGGAGLAGGTGGRGGDAFGGQARLFGEAGNGSVVAGDTALVGTATGGAGGVGGASTTGAGGAGGRGGDAIGGFNQGGIASGVASTTTTGTATFGAYTTSVIAIGGSGGAGGNGVTAQADGGAGGNAAGGDANILARGAPLVVGDLSFFAGGFGGSGGTGAIAGAGGTGDGGSSAVVASTRFQTTVRGTLTGGNLSAGNDGVGGTGSTTGLATAGQFAVQATDADIALGTASLTGLGAQPFAATFPASNFTANNGRIAIDRLDARVTGDLGLYTVNNGRLLFGPTTLTASRGLLFGDGTTPSNLPGDIDIDGDLAIDVGSDFVLDDDIDLDGFLSIAAGGRIQTGDIAAATGIALAANTGIAIGGLRSGGAITAVSGGGVTALDIESVAGSVSLQADGAVAIGNVRAGDSIDIFGDGSLQSGTLTALTRPEGLADGALGFVDIEMPGTITTGDISALGIDIDTETDSNSPPYGAIRTGNLTAETIGIAGEAAVSLGNVRIANLYSGGAADANGFVTSLGAAGDLAVGTIDAAGFVALGSLGGSVTSGAIATPSSVAVFAANAVTLAGAITGRGAGDSLFVSNASILRSAPVLVGAGLDDLDLAFDPAVFAGLTPVRIGGTFGTTGPIATGNLLVAARGGIAAGALDASTRIALDSGAAIALGNVTTPAALTLISDGAITAGSISAQAVDFTSISGTIATGAITSADGIALTALSRGGNITTGQLTSADDDITVTAAGAVTIAGATLGGVPASGDDTGIGIIAGTGLTIGAVDTVSSIGLLARNGNVSAGTLNARGGSVLILAAGNVQAGAASTAAQRLFYIGNASQFPADFDPLTGDFDAAPILAATPVRIGGALTLAGPVSTGLFKAAAAGGITTQAVTAGGTFYADSGNGISTGALSAGASAYAGGTGTVAIAGATVATGRLTVDTAGNVAIGAVQTGTDALLIATGSRIDLNGPVAAGGNIALLADTGIATGALSAARSEGRFVYLAASGNRTRIGADGQFQPTFATDPGSLLVAGPIAVGGAVSGSLIRTSGDGAVRFASTLDAASRVRLFGGSLALNGSVTGPAIELLGNDIALARGITVGDAATQTIALTALTTATPATLGGTGGDNAAGFTLDAAEIAQLRGGSIDFAQSTRFGSGNAQVILRDLTLVGADGGQAANLTSATGAFTVTGLGDIEVLGNVRMNGATATNALVLNAPGSIEIVTDTGSIGLFGSGDALGGRLALNADQIAVANARLIALGDDSDFFDIDPAEAIAAIGAPSGQARPEGFLQAGRLELAATTSIAIQNSNTDALAGGFTAGSGGMRITSLARGDNQPTDPGAGLAVIVYGRVQGEAGAFVTNADTRGAITFVSQGSQAAPLAGFADFSVVNGCALLASTACGGAIAPEQEMAVVTIGTDVQGIVESAVSSSDEAVAAVPDVRLTTVIDTAALTTDSIISDPVASAGNPSLWESSVADGPAGSRGEDEEERKRASGGASR